MGSKSQRRKEQHARRRNEKRKRQQQSKKRQESRGRGEQGRKQPFGFGRQHEIPLASNARHRERLAQQIPQSWPGELPEDVAVFENAALTSLPPELVPQVTAVREALQEALAVRGEEALKRVSEIPRSSPLSEWRLFIRGLIEWLADETDAAGETWKRLDPERRPGRIATAMMIALRSDLEHAVPHLGQAASTPSTDETGEPETREPQPPAPLSWGRFDAAQLYHAKLLRRVRFDRTALRVAETGLNCAEESKKLLLGPRKIHWLKRFIANYGDTEPELTAALAQTALLRASAQNYTNLFDEAARAFRGPRHDPRNRLLSFFYYSRYANDSFAARQAEQALNEYLSRDLPQNESLSAPLRSAITSHIHAQEAMSLMRPADGGIFDRIFAPPEDAQKIRNHLLSAVKAAPNNGAVYKAHVEWINAKLDNERLAKTEQKQLEEELARVMRSWSQGVPEEAEPRLWLVDHLLENEQLDEARPHVEFLAASRQENPRVRAVPWKWQLLEAMRLCRRKAWLAEVPARLEEAEVLWPAWLPKQWLPYLKAAWTLRTGRTEAFEEERRRICEETGRLRDSLADAGMMLGAAQQMRATAAELKPLRAVADRALQQIDSLPLTDLLETGGFFWDLHRVQLVYPAYRMHGKTIGKSLIARLAKNEKLVIDGINDPSIQKGVLWGSEHRFWPTGYDTKFPSFFSKPIIQRHPLFAAAKLNAVLQERYGWNIKKHRELEPLLRAAATTEPDAYYRYWFVELADRAVDKQAERSRGFSGFPFGNMFQANAADDELGFDSGCDCADCQAARKAHAQSSTSQSKLF